MYVYIHVCICIVWWHNKMGKLFTKMLPVFLLFQMLPTLPPLNMIKKSKFDTLHTVSWKIIKFWAKLLDLLGSVLLEYVEPSFSVFSELGWATYSRKLYSNEGFSRYSESFVLNCSPEYSTSWGCWAITRHNISYPKINSPIFFSHMIKSPKLRY